MSRIHHTAGVYPDGSFKQNGVDEKNLAGHIEYNRVMRPGRAFFVDGVYLFGGWLNPEEIAHWEARFKHPSSRYDRDTQPYV